MIFGSSGRFSEDLDFTLDSERPDDDVLIDLVESLNREHYGISFVFDEHYKTEGDTSFGGDVTYSHAWNDAGRFSLQVSIRERPTLQVLSMEMKHQAYFKHLEIDLFEVRCLQVIEMIAEKVRASYQRSKVRDLYDLYCFAETPFDGEVLRRMAVLKLWQARDPFDPNAFFEKLRGGIYDWDDLRRLVRTSDAIEPEQIIRSVEDRFGMLHQLTELEQQLIADAKSGWNEPLADRLRTEILRLAMG